jgi:DNA-binding response OmpR family regulator
LVVDDDPMIGKMLRPYLEQDRFVTLTAPSADEAVPIIERERPQLIVLDLTMPGKNGLDLLRSLRERSDTAVILLTGRSGELDRVLGLELGADDYVTKPFSPREVVSRIKTVLRRARPQARANGAVASSGRVVAGDLCIDPRERSVTVAGADAALTPTEFRILEVLASEPGRAFSRSELLDRVNADALDVGERTLDSHITHLRQKIEPEARPHYVLTVYAFGYKFNKAALAR